MMLVIINCKSTIKSELSVSLYKTSLIPVLFLSLSLEAQDLKSAVSEVLSTNPIVLERLKNYNYVKEAITNAESGYYPKIDLNLGVGVEQTDKSNQAIAPDASDTFSVYQNSLKYTQNLFNGFGTINQVATEEYRTISAAYSYVEKANDRAFATVDAYLEVMKNQELLQTAQANVNIDQEIFEKVQKLYDSGLTTLSEVNKIESSLALAKSNLVVQENSILNAAFKLQRILGRHLNPDAMSKPTFDGALPATNEEAALFAIQNNPSVLVGDYNVKLAQATNKEKQSVYYPKIDIEVSESMTKNLSAVEGNNDKFRAMAYLSYNIFNGFADKSAIQKSVSKVHQEVETKNSLRRQVLEGLNLSWAAKSKLQEQLGHLQEYKKYSLKTLTLYTKEYDLGQRSLLDLLSAQNDFIGAKVQIINAEFSLLFAKYRVLDAMGTLVTTVLGEDNHLRSNVGLNAKTPDNYDSLPIQYDRDKDLIVDDVDLCDNSSSEQMKNVYGCELNDANVSQVERYGGFLFAGDKPRNPQKIQDLIIQLTPYGLENIKFNILGNAQDKSLSKDALLKLSQKRADIVKSELINAGASASNVTTYANADEAPTQSDESDKNNRVDVIVIKLEKGI